MRVPVIITTGLLAVLMATGTGTAAAHFPVITEFDEGLTNDSGAWGVTPGPDGNVWYTEEKLDSVAKVTPEGEVTTYPLGDGVSCPKGITLGPDGNLWVAATGGGGVIARVTPDGEVTPFSDSLMVGTPWDIAAGPDGNLWFVVKSPAAIGRITPDGQITLFDQGLTADSEPTAITAGSDGNLWFTESADPGRIGRITTAGEITEFSEGLDENMRPTDITSGPDGKLWFTMAGGGIGRIKPSGEITQYTGNVPRDMEPTGIAAGNDGALWFTGLADPGRIGRMTLDGSVTELRDGLTADRHPFLIARGPDGNMWFTENWGEGHIARVTVPPGVGGIEALEIGKTMVRLKGWVLGNSQTTDYRFTYGVSSGRENGSELLAAGRSAEAINVSVKFYDLKPGTEYKFHLVATNDAGTTISPTGKFTTAEEPQVAPEDPKFEVPGLAPDFSRSVVAEPRGDVRFKAPGGRWHTLDEGDELPVGVTIDARNGSVTLTSESDDADLQSGTFGGAQFAIKQAPRARGRVDLHLRGGNFKACPRPGANRRQRGRRAGASAARRVRRLWGRDRGGRFRTHGRHSHATVRGTRWVTEDRCNGTFTKVTEGSVLVRDLVRHKSVLLRAGRSYLARSRR